MSCRSSEARCWWRRAAALPRSSTSPSPASSSRRGATPRSRASTAPSTACAASSTRTSSTSRRRRPTTSSGRRHAVLGAALDARQAGRRVLRAHLQGLKAHDVRYFFYIGGNDSADTARIVNEHAETAGYDLRCVHIPKTIDNDLVVNDHTPGFRSAARFVALAFAGATTSTTARFPGVYIAWSWAVTRASSPPRARSAASTRTTARTSSTCPSASSPTSSSSATWTASTRSTAAASSP